MRLLFLFLLILPGLLPAATFTVTSTGDTSDPGTLRWAIEQHNAAGGNNEIVFAPSLAGQTIVIADPTIPGALPTIFGASLSIDGSAAPGITIDRNGGGRLFLVNSTVSMTLRGLTLRNARGAFGGSCFRATNAPIAVLFERVRFTDCESFEGASFDTLGGAVLVDFGNAGTLTIRDSEFIGNRMESQNNSGLGAAVYANVGQIRIERSLFELNRIANAGSAFVAGGAVYVENGEADLYDNIFTSNQSELGAGGALALSLLPDSSSFVERNTFVNNVADTGAAAWVATRISGDDFPFFNFSNNTFLGNSASAFPGATLWIRQGDMILGNNSFIQNDNPTGGAAHMGHAPGNTNFLSVWNNLFGPASSDACRTSSGSPAPFPSAGYNLLPDTSCGINGFNDIIGDAGPFMPLDHYGGQVPTVPPDSGNLAIDAGNPQPIGPGNAALCRQTDARGVSRPGDGDADGNPVCDIGAFEWAQEVPIFFDSFESPFSFPL